MTPAGQGHDPAVVRAFALSTMKPGERVLLLDRENRANGWTALDVALEQGVCFAVQPRDDLLVIDIDGQGAEALAEELASDLEAEGLRPVVVASGRPGHRHVLVRVDDPAHMERLAGGFKACDFGRGGGLRRGPGQRVRPPLSPHRLGLPTALVRPREAAEALRRLAPGGVEPASGRRAPSLSNAMRRLLIGGDTENRYESRSEALHAFLVAAVSAGWGLDECVEALLDPRHVLGAKAREKRNPRRWLDGEYRRAQRFVADHPPRAPRDPDVAKKLAGIRRAMAAERWVGAGPLTDRAVLGVVVDLAEHLCRLEVDLAARDVADRAGVARRTASRSLRRLERAGWLRRHRRTRVTDACRLELRWPPRAAIRDDPHSAHDPHRPTASQGCGTCGPPSSAPSAPRGLDAFRYRGLGKACEATYGLLGEEPVTARQIATRRGVQPAGVRKALKKLEAVGLATPQGTGWVRVAEPDMQAAAALVGTEGVGARQRERHRREREEWAEHRAALEGKGALRPIGRSGHEGRRDRKGGADEARRS